MSINYLGCPCSIYSNGFGRDLLEIIKNSCSQIKMRLVEIHFDDVVEGDNCRYTEFDKYLCAMPCSILLFFIHKNNSKDIVCAGITSKANVYPNTLTTSRFYNLTLRECMLLPLSVLDERKKNFSQNLDCYLKNFFVRYILFDSCRKSENCGLYIRTLCKYYSVKTKGFKAGAFYFREIIDLSANSD